MNYYVHKYLVVHLVFFCFYLEPLKSTTTVNENNVQENDNAPPIDEKKEKEIKVTVEVDVNNFSILLQQAHTSILDGSFEYKIVDDIILFLKTQSYKNIIPALNVLVVLLSIHLNYIIDNPKYAAYFCEGSKERSENGVLILLHKINDCVNSPDRTIESIYLVKIFQVFTLLSYTPECLSSIYKPDKQQKNNIFNILSIIIGFNVYNYLFRFYLLLDNVQNLLKYFILVFQMD